MMRLVVLSIFISICGSALGQKVVGKLISDGQPLAMANVIIFKEKDSSKPVVFTSSDSLGSFTGHLPAPGNYDMRIQLIGFTPWRKMVTVSKEGVDLGMITMVLENRNMQEITVTAWKKMIQRTNSGFTVQTDAILTQAAGTATDLLANIPSVLVDPEGAISVRGKSPLILINGRNSNLGNNLNRIPASSVERIEIINNPGAKYDADGEGGVINIILKKNMKQGTNGAFALSGGYGAHERFAGSFMMNHRPGNTNLGLSYDTRIGRRTRQIEASRENFNLDDGHFLDQHRFDERKEINHNLKFNADHTTKRKDVFSFEGIYSYGNDWNYETLHSALSNKAGDFGEGNVRISDERQKENEYEGSLNYIRKFSSSKKQLSAGISHSFGDESENTLIESMATNESEIAISDPYYQKTRNDELSHITNLRLDMTFPLGSKALLDAGYKGIIRKINSDFETSYEENGDFISDPLASNIFDFNEQVHAIYGTYRSTAGKDEKWKYEMGIRLEQMMNKGESDKALSSFSNSYFNFFPNLNLSYKFNSGSFVKLNIGRRINRPGLGQLNPFIDITDSLNPHGGNPDLKPELVNTAELGWGKDWEHISVNANLFYRAGHNTILPYIQLLPGGIALSRPENIGSSTTAGMETFVTVNTGKVWNSTASISLYNQVIKGSVSVDEVNSSIFSWYTKWVNNFNIRNNLRAQILLNYQAPTAVPQGTRIAVYNADIGIQQKLMKGKARIGMTVTDIFNTLKNGNELETTDFKSYRYVKSDTRAVFITFAMTFGTAFKEKIMENKYSPE
jgi:outer membrane receptor protein involved in Fe transport